MFFLINKLFENCFVSADVAKSIVGQRQNLTYFFIFKMKEIFMWLREPQPDNVVPDYVVLFFNCSFNTNESIVIGLMVCLIGLQESPLIVS